MRRPSQPSPFVCRPSHATAPAAWLVAVALLLQTCLGLPLTVSMASDPFGSESVELCGQPIRLTDDRTHPSPLPGHRHQHDQCALCLGGLGPLLTAAAPIDAATPFLAVPSDGFEPATMTVKLPPLAYASRAPPLTA
jgi:hypothetical protein